MDSPLRRQRSSIGSDEECDIPFSPRQEVVLAAFPSHSQGSVWVCEKLQSNFIYRCTSFHWQRSNPVFFAIRQFCKRTTDRPTFFISIFPRCISPLRACFPPTNKLRTHSFNCHLVLGQFSHGDEGFLLCAEMNCLTASVILSFLLSPFRRLSPTWSTSHTCKLSNMFGDLQLACPHAPHHHPLVLLVASFLHGWRCPTTRGVQQERVHSARARTSGLWNLPLLTPRGRRVSAKSEGPTTQHTL